MLALLWTAFTLFLAATIWKTAREHAKPELGYSSRDNHREAFFARFVKKMSLTAVLLCVASAIFVWSSPLLAVLLVLAIPAVAALQVARSKRSIESSGNRSLPRFP
jgi:hypothetical protein